MAFRAVAGRGPAVSEKEVFRAIFVACLDHTPATPSSLAAVTCYSGGNSLKTALATGISRRRCRKVNIGYMDPGQIDIRNYENREDKGILVVHHAGEMLYRLSDGSVPTIPNQ